MKGFTKDGKFRPTERYTKNSLSKHDLQKNVSSHSGNADELRNKKTEEFDDLNTVIKRVEKEWKEALNKDDELPKVDWDVDITHTGSHGTVDSEYFTLTAFGKGLGDVVVDEALSNDDWMETGDYEKDEKLSELYLKDPDKAEHDYDEWLATTFDAYEDGMYEALRDTIVATYDDPDRKKFTLDDYLKNEDINYHTENAVALTERFGTPEEIKEIHEIQERHDKSDRGISHEDSTRRYEIANKYYKNLLAEAKQDKE